MRGIAGRTLHRADLDAHAKRNQTGVATWSRRHRRVEPVTVRMEHHIGGCVYGIKIQL
jgi:hypothetical protein